ncbi:hypothetical protein QNI23_003800 [Bermanella sp. WJH001]|uniref:capsular polysaccharide export protein, LipB/KpsS family n=1 Tax=Bermanella sp. WJH001 TaxID=3048005 RepID=UPI0024BE5D0C|nr:hypothetical protein [Bermanella sp. WJH001]MDJ1539605.1 hypothetical protein [Bermanella sp. WJH001]
MLFSISSLFKSNQEDNYIAGDREKKTILLLDLDPELPRLCAIFQELNHPVVIIAVNSCFTASKIYDAGQRVTRGKISEKMLAYSTFSSMLFVSSDVNSHLREVVDVSNTLGIKTTLLSFESIGDGSGKYRNVREGYDYPITDRALFVDQNLMREVASRNKGPSSYFCVGKKDWFIVSKEHKKFVLSDYNCCCLIESAPVDYIGWIIKHGLENNIKIFVRQDIFKKAERDAYSKYCTFIPSGEKYKTIYSAAHIIYKEGNIVQHGEEESSYLTLPEALYHLSSVNKDTIKQHLTFSLDIDELSRLIPISYDKPKYTTLVLNLKRGDNLFGSLNWYPKLLGCNNHVIYRGGDVDGDVYASFGLPDDKTQEKLIAIANKNSAPYYNIENGFLAFSGIALLNSAKSHSLLLDSKSMYFDGISGSSIEDNILFSDDLTHEEEVKINSLIERITVHNLSKYNHAPQVNPILPGDNADKVLIVDQRYADKSIGYAGATEETFNQMLMDAYKEHPNSDIIIKVHPDALTGLVKGHFDKSVENMPRVYLYSEDINPVCLLKSIHSVYVVSSQMGFEALMLNKPVHVYGKAIYAGWGLTIDRTIIERRGQERRSIQQLFKALYMDNVPYIDPVSGDQISIDSYLDELISVRGSTNANSKVINVGDGQIVYNSVVDRFYLEKDGVITSNTVLNALYNLPTSASIKTVLCSLKTTRQFPPSSDLLEYMVDFFQGEMNLSSLENKLIDFNKKNDVFNLLKVFSREFKQESIIRIAMDACKKSKSAIFVEKFLYWSISVLAKMGVEKNQLYFLISESDALDVNSKNKLIEFSEIVSGEAC